MKIALFYEHRDIGSSGSYVERAFRSLGHQVTYFRKSELPKASGFDLYFRVEDGEYGYSFSAKQRPAVYWTMDTHVPYSLKKILEEVPGYDFVFACHTSGARLLQQKGIPAEWLPVGCDPEIHGKLEIPKTYQVASIGKEEGTPRKFLLQEIRERYHPTFIKKAHFSQMQSVYSASKIGFNQAINRDVNMRVFEVMCAGAMLLTSDVEDGGYAKLGFEEKKHLVIYRNMRQVFEFLDYYLAYDAERERIADAGRKLVCENHTYKHRMSRALSILESKGLIKNTLTNQISSPKSASTI